MCIIDEAGKVYRAMKVASHPVDLRGCSRILLGILSGSGLKPDLYPMAVRASCQSWLAGDLHRDPAHQGISPGPAEQIRSHLFLRCPDGAKRRALLSARKLLQDRAIAIEKDIRGICAISGLKVGMVSAAKFEQRIHELAEGLPDLIELLEPLLDARSKLRQHFAALHRNVLVLAREDGRCRLMTVPGGRAGRGASLHRNHGHCDPLRSFKAVGPVLGLTPMLSESGESRRVGRISLCGDAMVRALLYEAAQVLLARVSKWS
ncbi:MAG: transposase [Mesorhizobium sp.]|nr:MAG: transposase [Mesorhizobium sp.]